jgi:2-polyprenyl-3-methyl-5-hydroxy-6-metoxy-1,4-benzoquinol methylase
MMLRRRQASRLREAIAEVPLWWHSIDFGNGVVAPGHKTPGTLAREWASLGLDSLQGLSVLDIGAWDGFFSFSAERAGAARVVALDYYAWGATRQNAHIRGQERRRERVPPRRASWPRRIRSRSPRAQQLG